jgi:ribosomal-protein-alanine N-acetyltransferase
MQALNLNFDPFPVMVTESLVLREMTEADAPEVFIMRSHPEVVKYVDRAPAVSVDEALQFIRMIQGHLTDGKGICWAITLKGSDTLIGTVDIWRISPEHFRAEIGYALLPQHHGSGIMKEALRAALHYGFHTMHLHSVEANVNPANTASIKLLERMDFVREAYYKENYYYDGRFLDSAVYSLLSPI